MNKKLFVRNLSWSVSEDDLYEIFGRIGEVISVKIPLRREDSRPRGFAFVEMANPDLAQKAIKQLNGMPLDDREIHIDYQDENRQSTRPENKNSKIFIRNISPDVSEYELENLFSQIGRVISARIPTDRETGSQKPFGFIEMSTLDEAENAVNQLNNSNLGGQIISVSYQNNDRDRKKNKPQGGFNKSRYSY